MDRHSDQSQRRYQGVASMSFTLANFFSPILGGLLLDNTPGPTLWIVLAAIAGVVATGQIVTGPARERRVKILDHQGVPVAVSS